MIIINKTMDVKRSKELFQRFGHLLERKQCYRNIFNLVYSELVKEYLVAFGYYGIPSVAMVRHCYLVSRDKTTVIDPTLVIAQKGIIFNYHTFKVYTPFEYSVAIEDYLQGDSDKEFNLNFKSLLKNEENNFYKYAVDNDFKIDSFSYETYLSFYDKDKKTRGGQLL